MRRGAVWFCLAILFSIFIAAAPAKAAGSLDLLFKESEATDAKTTEKHLRLYSASKALVIGIDDYTDGWPKLSMAVKDAEAVKDALTKQGFTVTPLMNLKSGDLERVLKEFFVKEGADPEARLVVWFAGHGHTIDGEGYIIPADAPDPRKDDIAFRIKALALRRFGEYMRDAKSKHVLAVFDSCFGGKVFQTARGAPLPPAITYATAQPVREFISSGEADQMVSDNGLFRRLFVDALEGREPNADANQDGYVTGMELGQFLFDKTTNYTNMRQTPRWGKLNEPGYDRGDIVFEKGKLDAPPAAPEASAGNDNATKGVSGDAGANPNLLSEAAQSWPIVKDSTDIALLEAFRKQYCANVFYCELAAARIASIQNETDVKKKADEAAKAEQEQQQVVTPTENDVQNDKTAAQVNSKGDLGWFNFGDDIKSAANLGTLLATTWKRVCTSARNAEEARHLIDLAKPKPWVNGVLLRLVPEWSQTRTCYNVTAPIKGGSFGQMNSYEEMLAKARELGVTECPWELAIALRIALLDMKEEEGFLLATKLLVRANPSDNVLRLPSLGHGRSAADNLPEGNWLTNYMGGAYMNSYRRYVFCIRP